jgi:predicted MFS family arabinose efflux permease
MLSNVALGPTNVLPPMLIKEDFNGTAAALGVFDSFIGIGLLIGAVFVGIVSPKKIGIWFSFGLGMQCIGLFVISFSPNLIFANLGNLILGIAIIITNIPMSTFFQVMVPTNMRGRVNSISSVSFNFSIPITYGVVGILADKIGAQEVYAIGTAILFICVVLAFTNKELVKSYIGVDEGKKQEQLEK